MKSDWTVTPLTGYFGASLTGRRITDGFDTGWLLSKLEEHLFLVLPDQHITHAEQVALARELGEPTPAHSTTPGHPDFPEILVLEGDKGGKNARWHTDVTFMVTPPTASVLVADVVPVAGGDTLWADTCTAYDRLSEPLRRAVDGLEAVHIITPLAYWASLPTRANNAMMRCDSGTTRRRFSPSFTRWCASIRPPVGQLCLSRRGSPPTSLVFPIQRAMVCWLCCMHT